MKRKKEHKTPQEKKELSYKNEYPVRAEYPHAFRRQWPKTESLVERQYRRKVKQVIKNTLGKQQLNNEIEEIEVKIIRREKLKKYYYKPTPLREVVKDTLSWRLRHFAWNYFKHSYDKELHFDKFSKLLSSIIEGKTDISKSLALQFSLWLNPYCKESKSVWLESYFSDSPDKKKRLLDWIKSFSLLEQ